MKSGNDIVIKLLLKAVLHLIDDEYYIAKELCKLAVKDIEILE